MQKVSYQFKEAKTYTVTLTVWDYDGNEDSVTREVIVK